MKHQSVCEANWKTLQSRFSVDLEQTAREQRALVRRRNIADAASLLRLCLMYGFCSFSLEETCALAASAGVADLCDVSLLERLLKCEDWLKVLLTDLLSGRSKALLAEPVARKRVCLVDATVITIPGSTGVDWRVHLSLDLLRQCIDHVEITDCHGGESLTRFEGGGDRLYVGDRAYGTRRGIQATTEGGSDVLVRITWQNLPLMDAQGNPLAPLEISHHLKPGQILDVQAHTVATEQTSSVPGRLIVLRKSVEETEKTVLRARKERKNGRVPTADTIKACGYIFLFTTLKESEFTAEEVTEIYRLRWQIEMAFKRMKQVLRIGDLKAKSPQLCRVALLSNLIGILLSEDFVQDFRAFSPWASERPTAI